MKNLKALATLVLVTSVVGASFAQTKKQATPPNCPVCHMALSAKKTKANTVAVRLKKGGPIYYCCSACKMPASVLVKPTKKK